MAGAFRIWARHGYTEGLSGHISVRDPEFEDCFWTNPLGVHFGLLKASDMVLLRLDGTVMGGNRARPANAAGFLIHSAVHKARPEVHAVCHAHSTYGKAWSAFARPLEMLNQDVCKFYNAHSVYASYGGVVLAEEEGEQIAKALGQGKACILMNHGLLTVGGTVDEAAYLFGISDEEAAYNFKVESDPEILYCEFQPDYEYEEAMSNGAFKN
jgi:ribulose-5-phosphate 4-epimerase/fuculose-1-phosphate aldolase